MFLKRAALKYLVCFLVFTFPLVAGAVKPHFNPKPVFIQDEGILKDHIALLKQCLGSDDHKLVSRILTRFYIRPFRGDRLPKGVNSPFASVGRYENEELIDLLVRIFKKEINNYLLYQKNIITDDWYGHEGVFDQLDTLSCISISYAREDVFKHVLATPECSMIEYYFAAIGIDRFLENAKWTVLNSRDKDVVIKAVVVEDTGIVDTVPQIIRWETLIGIMEYAKELSPGKMKMHQAKGRELSRAAWEAFEIRNIEEPGIGRKCKLLGKIAKIMRSMNDKESVKLIRKEINNAKSAKSHYLKNNRTEKEIDEIDTFIIQSNIIANDMDTLSE